MKPEQQNLFTEERNEIEKEVGLARVEIGTTKKDATSEWEQGANGIVKELVGVLEEVREANKQDWGTFRQCLSLWRNSLLRYSPGAEESYLTTVREMQPEAVRLATKGFAILLRHFVMEQRFVDVLGPVYMEIGSRWAKAGLGQYFTPWNVCLCMAEITFADVQPTPEHPIKIYEPCLGSGAMLLAARSVVARRYGRESLRWLKISGQDIDPVCVMMAEIQLSLTDDIFVRDWLLVSVGEMLNGVEEK